MKEKYEVNLGDLGDSIVIAAIILAAASLLALYFHEQHETQMQVRQLCAQAEIAAGGAYIISSEVELPYTCNGLGPRK